MQLKGKVRAACLRDKCLDINSHPADWANAFFPIYKAKRKNLRTPHHLLVEKICKWSNEKALLMEMGSESLYPTFKPFSTTEFEQYS